MKKLYRILLISFFAFACGDNANQLAIQPPILSGSSLNERWKIIGMISDSIREGDLVLRCGNDFTSETLRDFNQKQKLFSHSGIALMDNGEMYIYNTLAGDLNPGGIMRRDPADSFLTPVNNVAVAVYRYDLTAAELDKLRTIVTGHYNNRLQFDMNFDLGSDDKMYCAEMIGKSVEKATVNRITFPRSIVNEELLKKYFRMALQKNMIPSSGSAKQKQYWSIDDLYLNAHCREVAKAVFGEPQTPIKFPTPENYQH